MRKKPLIVSLLAAPILGAAIALAIIPSSVEGTRIEAESLIYNLTLNAKNAPSGDGEYTAYTNELGNPIGFAFENGVSSEGAHIELKEGGSLHNVSALTGIKSIAATFEGGEVYLATGYRVDGLGEKEAISSGEKVLLDGGANYFAISAPAGAIIEEVTISYDCVGFPLEEDVRLEAENFTTNLASNYKGDPLASGGAFVGSLDNGGQGISFDYFAYSAGTREVEIAYATATPGSYHGVYLDGTFVTTAEYEENTGWFGDGHRFALTSVELELKEGWNSIALVKDGRKGDANFGGWAEIDYIEVKGLDIPFNPNLYEEKAEYVFDAELAHWHIDNGKLPFQDANNRLGYSVGEINAEGMGVDFENLSLPAGKYNFTPYVGADGPRNFLLSVDGKEIPFAGDLTGGAFNRALPVGNIEIELSGDDPHLISLTRAADSNWFCVDYIVLTPVE